MGNFLLHEKIRVQLHTGNYGSRREKAFQGHSEYYYSHRSRFLWKYHFLKIKNVFL